MTGSDVRRCILLLSVICPQASLIAQTQFFPLSYLDGNGPTSEATGGANSFFLRAEVAPK